MATAAELQVLIKGRDEASPVLRGLRTELRQTDMLLGQFGATSRFSHLATLGWVGAVGGAVGAAVALTKGFVDTAQEIQRLTVQTGFSAEAISRLRYQASLANSDIQELAPSLRLMARSVTDAALGVDVAAGAYQSLGLNVAELRRMAPEQQFDAIMVALAGVTDKTKQLDLAMQIFGRSGASALALVSGGVEGYRKAKEDAAKAAPIFSDAEIEAAETMDRLWKSIGFGIEKAKLGLITGKTSLDLLLQGTEEGRSNVEAWLNAQEQLTSEEEKAAALKEATTAQTTAATLVAQDAFLAGRRAIVENARIEMEASLAATQMGKIRGASLEEQKRLWAENAAAVKAYENAVVAHQKWEQLTPMQRFLIEQAEARERATREIEKQIPLEERRAELEKGLALYLELQAEGLARINAEASRIATATAIGASQERAAGIAAGGEAAASVRTEYARIAFLAGTGLTQHQRSVLSQPERYGPEIIRQTIVNISQFSGTQTELDRLGESVQNANRVRAD